MANPLRDFNDTLLLNESSKQLSMESNGTHEENYTPSMEDEQILLPGIMDEETLRLIETVVNGFILPVLVLFGVTGNIINMAVFVRQGLADRVNMCLFSLAISDTGFNAVHLASRTFAIFNLFDTELGAYWQARAFSLTGIYIAFLLTSNTLTLVIAVQRCIIVVSPLSAKRLPNSRQMACIIIGLYALNFLGTTAYCFRWYPGTCVDPVTNDTHDCIKVAQFVQDNMELWNALIEISFMTTIPIVSLAAVTTTNVVIAVRMRSVMAWRQERAHTGAVQATTSPSSSSSSSSSSQSANQREAAMTKMLLVMCVIYSICTAPSACQAVARQLVPDYVAGGRYNNIFYASLCISHLLESINCSVNFVIYCTMSSKFNETLREMFRRKRKGNGGQRAVASKAGGASNSEDEINTITSLAVKTH